MTGAFGHPGHYQELRLESLQGLDLVIFNDARHQGPLGRVQVQSQDVMDLVDEGRISRQLERLGPVRLEPEGPPDTRDRGPRHMPFLAAIDRVDQCAAFLGLVSSDRRTSTAIRSSLTVRIRPGLGASSNPSIRSARKR